MLLALAQWAVSALLLALPFALLISLITRPRETIGLVVFIVISGLIQDRPAAMIAIFGVLMTSCLIGKMMDRRSATTPNRQFDH